MTNSNDKTRPWRTALAGCAVMFSLLSLAAEEGIEAKELKAALNHAQEENAKLRQALEDAEAQRKALLESLAEAVRVSEEQVVSEREIRLKLQAFGVELFDPNEDSLEQRLLKAVRDLDISQQELDRRTAQLHGLSEAFLKYLGATPSADENERKLAKSAITLAGESLVDLGEGDAAGAGTITQSRIVSIDSEIGLVVFDAGRRTGLRVGTPIAVLRDEKAIYTALVVDVRDSIAGAVLQDRLADVQDVAVGDGIQLLPTQLEF